MCVCVCDVCVCVVCVCVVCVCVCVCVCVTRKLFHGTTDLDVGMMWCRSCVVSRLTTK